MAANNAAVNDRSWPLYSMDSSDSFDKERKEDDNFGRISSRHFKQYSNRSAFQQAHKSRWSGNGSHRSHSAVRASPKSPPVEHKPTLTSRANGNYYAMYNDSQDHAAPRNKYHRHHRRSHSTSNDLIFVERKHKRGRGYSQKYVPPDYEYKGKLKVKCMQKKMHRIPVAPRYVSPPCDYPTQTLPPPPMVPYVDQPMPHPIVDTLPPYTMNMHAPPVCGPAIPMDYYGSGTIDVPSHQTAMLGSSGDASWPAQHSYLGMASGPVAGDSVNMPMYDSSMQQDSYPPIPPGGKIIAQYVTDLDKMGGTQYGSSSYHHASDVNPNIAQQPFIEQPHIAQGPYEQVVERCVPRSKIIEVWRKQRRKSSDKEGPSYDTLKKDIIDTLTTEIKKLNTGTQHVEITRPTERDVKVVVQPIQPVFYLPKQQQQPTIVQPPQQPPPPAAPNVVYVPRNVYVPVIKPVFVPRERVIVRPQVVQVARPVVIDRPIPVTQRPIVIDRERPVPFPVVTRPPVAPEPPLYTHHDEHYIYRDNLPLAYGGRTGEFATGMNYGYVPVNENYHYVVSGVDEMLRDQLVQQSSSGGGYSTHSAMEGSADCFDKAAQAANMYSAAGGGGFYTSGSSPNRYSFHEAMGQDNRTALIETLRRAGTGCDNLEVLDPTVRPVWEPVDAKMLIQRYGSSAARFVSSSRNYENINMNDAFERSNRRSAQYFDSGLESAGSGHIHHHSFSTGNLHRDISERVYQGSSLTGINSNDAVQQHTSQQYLTKATASDATPVHDSQPHMFTANSFVGSKGSFQDVATRDTLMPGVSSSYLPHDGSRDSVRVEPASTSWTETAGTATAAGGHYISDHHHHMNISAASAIVH